MSLKHKISMKKSVKSLNQIKAQKSFTRNNKVPTFQNSLRDAGQMKSTSMLKHQKNP